MDSETFFKDYANYKNVRTAFDYSMDYGLADKPMKLLDEKLMQLERSKLAESVKTMYSTHISKVVGSKMHAMVTPSMSKKQFGELNSTATSGQDFFDKTHDLYEQSRNSLLYKMKRSGLDKFRSKVVKDMHNHVLLPLDLIPDGGITNKVASVVKKVILKRQAIAKGRKKNNYTKNKADVASALGDSEAQRKAAKWQAKSIGGIGEDLQRNLFKFKQAARLLNQRDSALTSRKLRSLSSDQKAISSADMMQIKSCLADFSMSCCETEHYADKISDFCTALDLIVNDIKAHVDNIKEVIEAKKATIVAEGDHFFK
nr:hypothetical protein [uncultured Moellerella sp.]